MALRILLPRSLLESIHVQATVTIAAALVVVTVSTPNHCLGEQDLAVAVPPAGWKAPQYHSSSRIRRQRVSACCSRSRLSSLRWRNKYILLRQTRSPQSPSIAVEQLSKAETPVFSIHTSTSLGTQYGCTQQAAEAPASVELRPDSSMAATESIRSFFDVLSSKQKLLVQEYWQRSYKVGPLMDNDEAVSGTDSWAFATMDPQNAKAPEEMFLALSNQYNHRPLPILDAPFCS